MIDEAIDTAPSGTSGLAGTPWAADEVYAVAADWGQASAPVWSHNGDDWAQTMFQVADYSHSPRAALIAELREAVRAAGDDPDEAFDFDAAVDAATEF
jgi:hypothetical protein